MKNKLKEAASKLQKRFAHFNLIMNIGYSITRSKFEAMYFPPSLLEAKELEKNGTKPKDIVLHNNKERNGFTLSFRYLGSIITSLLNEEAEIKARIRKAKSIIV